MITTGKNILSGYLAVMFCLQIVLKNEFFCKVVNYSGVNCSGKHIVSSHICV